MYTNEEKHKLVKLWANIEKRRAFVGEYKTWGVWFTVPELDLTFYKYDIPEGNRIIAMEYKREPHYREETGALNGVIIDYQLYLQRSEYFKPSCTNDYAINDYLKDLKVKMQKELKESA